jgi:tyrosyl-tRNA synthetase
VGLSEIESKIGVVDFLAEKTNIFASKGEARRMLKDNGVSINKEKVKDAYEVSKEDLLNEKYILVQKGKKNYFLVKVI